MKRELAFAIQSFTELGASPGRTRSSKLRPDSGIYDDVAPESSRKRRKEPPRIGAETRGEIEEGPIGNDSAKENGFLVETTIEQPNSSGSVCEVEKVLNKEMIDFVKLSGDSTQAEDGHNQTGSRVEMNINTETSVLTPSKKLEMKMSKKIGLAKVPKTVKELFATGLLEGYPVFYNGAMRGPPLRGLVKDVGIMCLCSSCMGSRIFTPFQFEIHACDTYKRAAQYICFENGSSLLDVVKACKESRLDSLDETIVRVVGPLTIKESIVCLSCKGSFVASNAAKPEQHCKLCVSTTDSNSCPENTTDSNNGSSRLASPPDSQPIAEQALEPDVQTGSVLRRSGRNASGNISYRDPSEDDTAEDRVRKSAVGMRRSGRSGTEGISSPVGGLRKRKNDRSSKVELSSEFSGSISELIPDESESPMQMSSRAILGSRTPKVTSMSRVSLTSEEKSKYKLTRKDQRLHKMVFEKDGLPDGTEVAYYSDGKKLLPGYKKDFGICCSCCDTVVSASTFEAHAGRPGRRKPYNYIYISNGVSLHEFAISLLKNRNCSAKDNDDLCIICADGGDLLLCDGCPRAFHKECASVSSVPHGKWFCQYCQNMFVRERFVECNANAVAAGRVAGVDLIEQITKRCIRIVQSPENEEIIACVLCRGFDFRKTGFGPRTVIVCDQCEKEFHVGCLKEHNMADLEELPEGKWFCGKDCTSIFSDLQNLLDRGEEKIYDTLLKVIKQKNEENLSDAVPNLEVKWRVLNGKIASQENRSLLSKAVSIFHESFDPIVDAATGRDFIPSMVYGRNIKGQDFAGMYCAVLIVNSAIVSAGLFRVFGNEIAELPLVATSNCHQGKGYFQLLFSCIEKLLACLKVKDLVLPAAPEAESIWTDKFGFKKMDAEKLGEYRKMCWQMLTFQGTCMLQKVVPNLSGIQQEAIDDELEEW